MLLETHKEGGLLKTIIIIIKQHIVCGLCVREADLSDVGSARGCRPGAWVLDWILWALFGWAWAAEKGTTQDEKCSCTPADVKRGTQLSPLCVGQDGVVEIPDDGVGGPADGDEDENTGADEDDPSGDGHLGFGDRVFHKVGAFAPNNAQEDPKDADDDGDDHKSSGGLKVLG